MTNEIYTLITPLCPLRIIPHERSDMSQERRETSVIVVTKWGGQTVIDGVQVTVEDLDLRSFNLGEELLLCLSYNGPTVNTASLAAVARSQCAPTCCKHSCVTPELSDSMG